MRLAIDRLPRLLWVEPFQTTNSDQVKLRITYEGDSELDHLFLVFNNEPLAVETPQGRRVVIEVPLQLVAQYSRLVVFGTDRKRLRARRITAEFEYLQDAKGPGSPTRPEWSDIAPGGAIVGGAALADKHPLPTIRDNM